MSEISFGKRVFSLETPVDISIPISFSHSVQAFGVEAPTKETYQVGGFVGDVKSGGSCNCAQVTINPHCHGTHTECVGHILEENLFVGDVISPVMEIAQLITVDAVEISSALLEQQKIDADAKALIVRTLPNSNEKKHRAYQSQAPYFTKDAAVFCHDQGIVHLLVDFPSLDPMEDGGKLLAHRAFWNVPEGVTRKTSEMFAHKSITELIFVDSSIADGIYLLNLQMSNMELDAVLSRPLLYKEVK